MCTSFNMSSYVCVVPDNNSLTENSKWKLKHFHMNHKPVKNSTSTKMINPKFLVYMWISSF